MCLFVKAITFAPFEISWKTTSSVKFNVVYRGRKHSIKSIAWRKTVLVAFSINLKIRTAWSRRELYHLIAKIDRFNSIERRPLTVLFVTITTLMKSPTSHTNWGSRDDTDVSRSSVHCITKTDLKLNCLKRERVHPRAHTIKPIRVERLQSLRELLKRYLIHSVDFIWFSHNKLFTVSAPSNLQYYGV